MRSRQFLAATDSSDEQRLAARLLDVIETDILPKTAQGVAKGDKVFGAALLRYDDGALVIAETNREHSDGCPLWHGEMVALREFFALPDHPAGEACFLLSTHEPCPMCAAAIAWSNIRQVYFLFDYTDTEQQFSISHDIRILCALFAPASGLARDNDYFTATPIRTLTDDTARLARIAQRYEELSTIYQSGKDNNTIPLK